MRLKENLNTHDLLMKLTKNNYNMDWIDARE